MNVLLGLIDIERRDLLQQLLDLNRSVAGHIDAASPVTSPGVPADYPDPAKLVSDECIRP